MKEKINRLVKLKKPDCDLVYLTTFLVGTYVHTLTTCTLLVYYIPTIYGTFTESEMTEELTLLVTPSTELLRNCSFENAHSAAGIALVNFVIGLHII